MNNLNSVARDFVLFCINRNGDAWPSLYDEMCRVAHQRLFRGMNYNELRSEGISLSLSNLQDTIKLIDSVTGKN